MTIIFPDSRLRGNDIESVFNYPCNNATRLYGIYLILLEINIYES
ncbi:MULTISPECIES: hypothetical protein [unclassified Rickettsia]